MPKSGISSIMQLIQTYKKFDQTLLRIRNCATKYLHIQGEGGGESN